MGGKPRVHYPCPCETQADYHRRAKPRPHGLCGKSIDFPVISNDASRVTCKACTALLSEPQP